MIPVMYERVESFLEKIQMSKRQLAVKAEIPYSSLISSFSRRSKSFPIESVERIAKVLGVTTDFLLGKVDFPFPDLTGQTMTFYPIQADEFNSFARLIEAKGYFIRYDDGNGQYFLCKGSTRVPVSLENLRALIRTSSAAVGALIEDFMQNTLVQEHEQFEDV